MIKLKSVSCEISYYSSVRQVVLLYYHWHIEDLSTAPHTTIPDLPASHL